MSAQSAETKTRRAFCSALSHLSGEPLAATASRVDHWILIEYGGAWARDPIAKSALSTELKTHLRAQLASVRHARLLFVKRRERGSGPTVCVFFGTSRPGAERLLRIELDGLNDLLDVEFAPALAGSPSVPAESVEGPLYLVCTHGKRDRCCALYGRPVYDALRHAAGAGRVWQSTHVGGDRFAGNVVVLPHGLYYGRVDPDDAGRLLDATASGRLVLETYRGRSAYPFPVQAAERALRESEALAGIDDVQVLEAAAVGDGRRRVRLRTLDGRVHELLVAEEAADEPTYLTCDSPEPQRPRRWVVSGGVSR